MLRSRRIAVVGLALFGAVLSLDQPRAAGTYPSQVVRIILPFAPGSILDSLTRIVANGLSQKWGQSVIVDNVPGSGGNLGTERFSRATPDGYTLLAGPPGPFTINRLLFKNISFDASAFVPISVMGTVPNVLVVRKDFPAKTFVEFVDYARANPGKITYASQGVGTTPYLVAKLLEKKAGVEMLHVPYRGSSLAQNDLAAGHIDSFFDALSNGLPVVQAGHARILAITDKERSPLLPDVPTVASYYPGFFSVSWFALAAPAGTPSALADRISADVAQIVSEPATNAQLRKIGLTPVGNTAQETAKFIAEEDKTWSQLIKDIGLQPQ